MATGPGGSLTNEIDDVLCSVAEKLWEDAQVETLGKKLGIDIARVQRHIKRNYAQGQVSHEGTKSMLREWAADFESDTFWPELKKGLEGARLRRVAENVEKQHSSFCSSAAVPVLDQIDTGGTGLNMASRKHSVILRSDCEIYELSGCIPAVDVYSKLGLALLGSASDVANIIGKTQIDYQEVVYKCLYTWRNANGSRASDALLSILSDPELRRAKSYLENELKTNPKCLGEDKFLQDLMHQIDCARDYKKLCLKLVKNAAALDNIMGHPNPQYQEALHKVLIKWRDREGASLAALEKLKKILEENGQMKAVDWIDEKEYGKTREPVRMSESQANPTTDEACSSTGDAFPALEDTTNPRSSGDISHPKWLQSSNQQSTIAPMQTKEGASNVRASGDFVVQNSLQSSSQQNASVVMQQGAVNRSGLMERRYIHTHEQFYDIYLVYSIETDDVRKVKDIIRRRGLTMTTPFNSRLGVLETESIEHALEKSSHVVLVITEEDCRGNDRNRTLTIEMAFQSSEGSLSGRVIPILCCDKSCLPLKLRSLTSANINDDNMETRLVNSIDTSIRLDKFQSLSVKDSPTSS